MSWGCYKSPGEVPNPGGGVGRLAEMASLGKKHKLCFREQGGVCWGKWESVMQETRLGNVKVQK